MKQIKNQPGRLLAMIFYFLFLFVLFQIITGNLYNFIFIDKSDARICFFSGALLLLLGNYLLEPYYTKPSDSLVNSVTVIIALIGISDRDKYFGYTFIIIYSIVVLIMSITTIFTKDKFEKFSKSLYYIVERIGKSKVIFSIVYVSGIYSYFGTRENIIDFIILLSFWMLLVCTRMVEGFVDTILRIAKVVKSKSDNEIGYAIGCENPFLFSVDITDSNYKPKYGDWVSIARTSTETCIGTIVHIMQLHNKKMIEVYLSEENGKPMNIEEDKKGKNIFNTLNMVKTVEIDTLTENIKKTLKMSELYINFKNYIGFVTVGSNINKVNFVINRRESELEEGQIIEIGINGVNTLYQVVDGQTNQEIIREHNKHGYITGIAMKLGVYNNDNNELEVKKWVPTMYTPVYVVKNDFDDSDLADIAVTSIGRLPNSKLRIPIRDIDSLVTHNTAVLGILGIGKSCLAFELIKKVSDNDIKVICIDITNQYSNDDKGLPKYIDTDKIFTNLGNDEQGNSNLKTLKDTRGKAGKYDSYIGWGNVEKYNEILDSKIEEFIKSDKKVLILNPDWHSVTKAAAPYKVTGHVDLTAAEKTRIISERVFIKAMKDGESERAKIWLVYEEAHSLIPEWNSVANEGDKTATNGTAKVILQGRKYGLGCMVLTQRTANISKSILNQCNTVFALRIFDDTGKNFLENYVGKDYSNVLPQLDERHAVVVGKGLRLKQPIITELNDLKYVCIKVK